MFFFTGHLLRSTFVRVRRCERIALIATVDRYPENATFRKQNCCIYFLEEVARVPNDAVPFACVR